MMTPQTTRSLMLGMALFATLAATAWTSMHDDKQPGNEVVEAKRSDAEIRASNPTSQPKRKLPLLVREAMPDSEDVGADLFKTHAWYVPPPPPPPKPVVVEPPPKPVAPPAPFSYMGKLEDGPQGTLIFLTGNNKTYSVALGANVDPNWRLDGEDANALRLTYLPLGLSQTLQKATKASQTKQNENKGISG